MTASAWIFMLAVWGIVIAFTLYCFSRLLTSKPQSSRDAEE